MASAAIGPSTALAQPADSVTARWRAYDQQVRKLPPQELAAVYGGDTPAGTAADPGPAQPAEDGGDALLPAGLAGLAILVAPGGAVHTMGRSRARVTVPRGH